MSSNPGIRVSVERDILWVTIKREEQLNALSLGILGEIDNVFSAFAAHEQIHAAIITADGARCFAAGGDLRELDEYRDAQSAKAMIDSACRSLDAIRQFPTPVIAALNGDALGGGAELALACDIRVFAPHAKIAFLQGSLNILPSWGGYSDLIELVGMSEALALLTSNRYVDASEARTLGLAQYVAPEGADFQSFLEQCLQPMRDKPVHLMRALKRFKLERNSSKSNRTLESELSAQMWLHQTHWDAAQALVQAMDKKKQGA